MTVQSVHRWPAIPHSNALAPRAQRPSDVQHPSQVEGVQVPPLSTVRSHPTRAKASTTTRVIRMDSLL